MKTKNKLGFTLVELIVVITILAILGTIAFISLQGYSRDARDSVRIADISNIKSSLELFSVKGGSYPAPTDGVDVTYSGAVVWNQGTIGNSVITNLQNLSSLPVDPSTGNEYTYSRLDSKKEYEIGTIIEGSLSVSNTEGLFGKAHAAGTNIASAYVRGNYNGLVAKAQSGSTTYVLALPSIINGDMSLIDIIQIALAKNLVYNGYSNLADSYKDSSFNVLGEANLDLVNVASILVFSGPTSDLSGGTQQLTLIDNIQQAYSGTTISNIGIISQVLEHDKNSSEAKEYAKIIIKKSITSDVEDSYTCNPDIEKCYIDLDHYVVSELFENTGSYGCAGAAGGGPIENDNCIMKIYKNGTTVFEDFYIVPGNDIQTMAHTTYTAGGWNGSSFDDPTDVVTVAEPYCNSISFGNSWNLINSEEIELVFDNNEKISIGDTTEYWTSQLNSISSGHIYYFMKKQNTLVFDISIPAMVLDGIRSSLSLNAFLSKDVICTSTSIGDYIQ